MPSQNPNEIDYVNIILILMYHILNLLLTIAMSWMEKSLWIFCLNQPVLVAVKKEIGRP